MKVMTCEQLGGACSLEFRAETFEEMAELSKQHGMQKYKEQDPAHLEAMNKVGELMKTKGAMEAWQESKRKEFESLPDL